MPTHGFHADEGLINEVMERFGNGGNKSEAIRRALNYAVTEDEMPAEFKQQLYYLYERSKIQDRQIAELQSEINEVQDELSD